jgi:hypothetical protein
MNIINYIANTFDSHQLNSVFDISLPYPMIVLDNFLPEDVALQMANECETIPDQHWTTFTRQGSNMRECKQLHAAPIAYNFTNQLHSSLGINWLSQLTKIPGLIPDPHITGAGYSRIFNGESLKVHTDFNWNDQLRLHRSISFILYLNPNWKEEYGCALDFYDFNNEKVITSVTTLFNRAIIWKYHKRGFHGCTTPVACPPALTRNAFRLFFYTSDAQYKNDDHPHRSLYWFDKDLNEPCDIPTRT